MRSNLKLPFFNRSLSLTLSLFFSLLICGGSAAAASGGFRHVENFNREWRFKLGDIPGAESPEFDDATWDRIGLPHSFSMPYFAATNSFYVGYGWYRKNLEVPVA